MQNDKGAMTLEIKHSAITVRHFELCTLHLGLSSAIMTGARK
jgi:hypothetical protein